LLPTGQCAAAGYQQLQDYVVTALNNPFAYDNASALAPVTQLCAAACPQQLLTMGTAYVQSLPPLQLQPDASWCEQVAAPNVQPMLQTALPFLCLQNQQSELCLVEVGKALQETGLLAQLTGVLEGSAAHIQFGSLNQKQVCHALLTTSCCGQTFVDVAQALLLMSCHSQSAQALASLVQGCPTPLPAGCPYNFPAFAMPSACPEGGLVLPPIGTQCPIPNASCPVTSCELLCAILADDPPGEFSGPPSGAGGNGGPGGAGNAAPTGKGPAPAPVAAPAPAPGPAREARAAKSTANAATMMAMACAMGLLAMLAQAISRAQMRARGAAGDAGEQAVLLSKLSRAT